MERLLVYLLFPLFLCVSAVSGDSVKPEAVVATFGETPIYAEEMALHIRDHVAMVAVYFKTRHHTDLAGDNWLKAINGEIPLDVLKGRAVRACRVSKAIQLLALRHELAEKLPFPGFKQACERINQSRAQAKDQGHILYGPLRYSPDQLYKYKLTNMRNHLRDRDLSRDFDQRENDLQTAIAAEMEAMPVKLDEQIITRLLAEQVSAR